MYGSALLAQLAVRAGGIANPRETLGPHVSPTAAGHRSDDPDRDSVKAEQSFVVSPVPCQP